MITTVDGADAARNLLKMLEHTPKNTEIILVRIGLMDEDEWTQTAAELGQVAGRDLPYLADPLPRTRRIKAAMDEGRSVWTLHRSDRTLMFLNGIEVLARLSADRVRPDRPWPTMPPLTTTEVYVPGWDDE